MPGAPGTRPRAPRRRVFSSLGWKAYLGLFRSTFEQVRVPHCLP